MPYKRRIRWHLRPHSENDADSRHAGCDAQQCQAHRWTNVPMWRRLLPIVHVVCGLIVIESIRMLVGLCDVGSRSWPMFADEAGTKLTSLQLVMRNVSCLAVPRTSTMAKNKFF